MQREDFGAVVEPRPTADKHLRDRYIELLSNTLTMSLWNAGDGHTTPRLAFKRLGPEARDDGRDWPALAHTMIGRERMKNVRSCVEDVIARDIPGDFIETGVWRGGACIFMRGILEAYGIRDRRVWVADSFQGLPRPNRKMYPVDAGDMLHRFKQLAIPKSQVEENFRQYGLLDDQVVFLEGFFKDTLPTAPIGQLAIVRLDGDMYESTIDGLTNLYSKLSVGGYLIVDDYGLPRCRRAVDEFRSANGITDRIETIDWTGAYWQKGSNN